MPDSKKFTVIEGGNNEFSIGEKSVEISSENGWDEVTAVERGETYRQIKTLIVPQTFLVYLKENCENTAQQQALLYILAKYDSAFRNFFDIAVAQNWSDQEIFEKLLLVLKIAISKVKNSIYGAAVKNEEAYFVFDAISLTGQIGYQLYEEIFSDLRNPSFKNTPVINHLSNAVI